VTPKEAAPKAKKSYKFNQKQGQQWPSRKATLISSLPQFIKLEYKPSIEERCYRIVCI